MRRIARRGDLDVGEVEPGRQRAVGLQRLQRVEDAAVHERVDVHREPTFASDDSNAARRGLPSCRACLQRGEGRGWG